MLFLRETSGRVTAGRWVYNEMVNEGRNVGVRDEMARMRYKDALSG